MNGRKITFNPNVEGVCQLTQIDFGIQGNRETVTNSVTHGESTLDGPRGLENSTIIQANNPVPGGVLDRRMGNSTKRMGFCPTCGDIFPGCPGHFGHIKLEEAMFHGAYCKTLMLQVLGCVCFVCNRLAVSHTDPKVLSITKCTTGLARLRAIAELCKKVKVCSADRVGCGTPSHRFEIEKGDNRFHVIGKPVSMSKDQPKDDPIRLSAQRCKEILSAITPEDYLIMGIDTLLSDPTGMILTDMPVTPVTIRPTTTGDTLKGMTHNDMSQLYRQIIQYNQNLRAQKGSGKLGQEDSIETAAALLQILVLIHFSNDMPKMPRALQYNKKKLASVKLNFSKKQGRFRGNLEGKRVDFSARAVITSDPNIPLNGLGVPLKFVMNLTVPEKVTYRNKDYLQQLVNNGRNNYPGANAVLREGVSRTGVHELRRYETDISRRATVLEIGDVVERHMVDGDAILFNRQPSLHQLSLQGHIISVIRNPKLVTFRFNTNATEPYNADFDGDEMNMFPPQSDQTRAEVRLICNSAYRFITPTNSEPIVSAKQDSVIGGYLMLRPDCYLDWKQCMQILMASKRTLSGFQIPKGKRIHGSELFSMILPEYCDLTKKRLDGSAPLIIRRGRVISGVADKGDFKAIIKQILSHGKREDGMIFLDQLQRMALAFMYIRGFSIGSADCFLPDAGIEHVKQAIDQLQHQYQTEVTAHENDPYTIAADVFEQNMFRKITAAGDQLGTYALEGVGNDNGFAISIKCKARGTVSSMNQISATVGQVVVNGKRILPRFGGRSLPMFAKHMPTLSSGGFCLAPFSVGCDVAGYYIHAISAREGITDRSVGTSTSGYITRKISKLMEDISVRYDGTVRNSMDKIIQITFGDDGMRLEMLSKQEIPLLKMNNQQVREQCVFAKKEIPTSKSYTSSTNDSLYRKLIRWRDSIRAIQIKLTTNKSEERTYIALPLSLEFLIREVLQKRTGKPAKDSEIVDPAFVIRTIKEIIDSPECDFLVIQPHHTVKKQDSQRSKLVYNAYFFEMLSPRRCCIQYRMRKDELIQIRDAVYDRMRKVHLNGGDMVGYVAAQGISEPITQANMRTFQMSGVASNSGVSRVKELMEKSKNIISPIMTIHMLAEFANDKTIASRIASSLKYTILADLTEKATILFDPSPTSKNSVMTRDGAIFPLVMQEDSSDFVSEMDNLPWCLQLILSREQMLLLDVKMIELKHAIYRQWSIRDNYLKTTLKNYKTVLSQIIAIGVTATNDNHEIPVLHIRLQLSNYDFNTLVKIHEVFMNHFLVKGIKDIKDYYVELKKTIAFDAEGDKKIKEEWVVQTAGINVDDLAKIHGIDHLRTTYNHIPLILKNLGIEAARAAYIAEINTALDASGQLPNYQNVQLLADLATHTGVILAINRSGYEKMDVDPLARAGFEQAVDHMIRAAAFGQTDHLRCVSARYMTGQMIRGGTGSFDLFVDVDALENISRPEIPVDQIEIQKATTLESLLKHYGQPR